MGPAEEERPGTGEKERAKQEAEKLAANAAKLMKSRSIARKRSKMVEDAARSLDDAVRGKLCYEDLKPTQEALSAEATLVDSENNPGLAATLRHMSQLLQGFEVLEQRLLEKEEAAVLEEAALQERLRTPSPEPAGPTNDDLARLKKERDSARAENMAASREMKAVKMEVEKLRQELQAAQTHAAS